MDYESQPLGFKIQKVARYCQMYGLRRTWISPSPRRQSCVGESLPLDHFLLAAAGKDAFPVQINPTRTARSDVDITLTYTLANGRPWRSLSDVLYHDVESKVLGRRRIRFAD